MITRAKAGIFKPKAFLNACNSLEPSTIAEALSDPKWKVAMQAEYDALTKNNTWSLMLMIPTYKLGLVAYFLGVEVCYTDHGMHLF